MPAQWRVSPRRGPGYIGRMDLPEPFAGWFDARGWTPHPHQLALLAERAPAVLLIAPTGAGKTLAGFLPSLVELAARAGEGARTAHPTGARRGGGLHTLYVSPLKALAADIGRNLRAPVAEMGLALRIEDRTGDTPLRPQEPAAYRPARHPADHAREPGSAAVAAGGGAHLRGTRPGGGGRDPRAGGRQARRPAVARPRAPDHARARSPADGAVGNRREPGGDRRMARARLPHPLRRSRPAARGRHSRRRGHAALGRDGRGAMPRPP